MIPRAGKSDPERIVRTRSGRPAHFSNFRNSRASPNSPIMGSPKRVKAAAPILPVNSDMISARRSAAVELWHSSAAPAPGVSVSSSRNGSAT
jgi:hypothetical protein